MSPQINAPACDRFLAVLVFDELPPNLETSFPVEAPPPNENPPFLAAAGADDPVVVVVVVSVFLNRKFEKALAC